MVLTLEIKVWHTVFIQPFVIVYKGVIDQKMVT